MWVYLETCPIHINSCIASSTSRPGHSTPQMVEALRKAGITGLSAANGTVDPKNEPINEPSRSRNIRDVPLIMKDGTSSVEPSRSNVEDHPDVPIVEEKEEKKTPRKPTKRVSFSKDAKTEDGTPPYSDHVDHAVGPPDTFGRSRLNHTATPKGVPISAPDSKDSMSVGRGEEPYDPIVPEDESPDDAALRREMIQYNMGEVGAIVAELDLDEDEAMYSDGGSRTGDEDDDDDEEDEDQYGRSTQRVLTNEYLAEMQKLQQRLQNVGPMPVDESVSTADGGKKEQESRKPDQPNVRVRQESTSAKKGVRFANELDIQEAPAKPQAKTSPPPDKGTPMKENNRHSIHNLTVVERPFSATVSAPKHAEPDEDDPHLVRQQVTNEYHRMRNHIIQQQGGYTKRSDESETGEVPLTEAEGGLKKISRFKAAKLGKINP